jgi:NAD(P)-dependent dehydrogenase (short-subunit alcohol dehydrogenase family)
MVEALNADPVVSEALKRFPLPIARAASPDEIASAIAFLLSREASFFVGSVVFADGGTDAFARADDWPAPISDEHAATIFGAPTS